MRQLILLLTLLAPNLAWSGRTVKFGPEFTFASPNEPQPNATLLIERMRNHLVKGQQPGSQFLETPLGQFARFRSPNGWDFTINIDPGVVEVTMTPGTVEYFRQYESDMQDAIFASAANESIFPALFAGGGHINLDMGSFDGDESLIRNFLVDMYNHNELFLGVFGYDTHNALSWSMLPENNKAQFRAAIEAFDNAGIPDLYTLINHIECAFRKMPEPFMEKWHDQKRPRGMRELAINVEHMIDDSSRRIEIRAVRPQASMNVWIRQIDLIAHRLKYLEKIHHPIQLKERVPMQKLNVEKHWLDPPVQAQQALRSFYEYVTESGLYWRDHRDYLWPKWIASGELEQFENSDWFKKRESLQCERGLARANPR